jgi:hypothetical protein
MKRLPKNLPSTIQLSEAVTEILREKFGPRVPKGRSFSPDEIIAAMVIYANDTFTPGDRDEVALDIVEDQNDRADL